MGQVVRSKLDVLLLKNLLYLHKVSVLCLSLETLSHAQSNSTFSEQPWFSYSVNIMIHFKG